MWLCVLRVLRPTKHSRSAMFAVWFLASAEQLWRLFRTLRATLFWKHIGQRGAVIKLLKLVHKSSLNPRMLFFDDPGLVKANLPISIVGC